MKKLSIIFVTLLLSLSVASFGQQNANTPEIIVTFGNITPKLINGDLPSVTREELLANMKLTMPPPACDIKGFTFRIVANGKEDFLGPYNVTGDQLTFDIIKDLKSMEAPQGVVAIDNISVKCGTQEFKARPILIRMVTKK